MNGAVVGPLAVISNVIIIAAIAQFDATNIAEVFMTALAICDLTIGVAVCWRALSDHYIYANKGSFDFYRYTYWLMVGVEVTASITASLTATALSVDRCVALRICVLVCT